MRPRSENELLDAAARALGTPDEPSTDARIADAIGASKQFLSQCRAGVRHLSEAKALRLSELTGIPYPAVLAIIETTKAHRPEAKRAFRTLARLAFGEPPEQLEHAPPKPDAQLELPSVETAHPDCSDDPLDRAGWHRPLLHPV